MESMEPSSDWDADDNAELVEAYAELDDTVTFTVWGADWCPDTRDVLPDFAAVLDAAGIPEDRVTEIEVDRDKNGEGTAEYGIEYIPSIVVERDREEIARFVESEPVSAAAHLANQFANTSVADSE